MKQSVFIIAPKVHIEVQGYGYSKNRICPCRNISKFWNRFAFADWWQHNGMEELQKKYDTLVGKYNALLAGERRVEINSSSTQHCPIPPSEISDKEPIFFSFCQFYAWWENSIVQQLFKGRTDVLHEDSSAGQRERGGYQPVCTNEWQRGGLRQETIHQVLGLPKIATLLLWQSREIYRHLREKMNTGCDLIGLYAVTRQ